MTSQLLVVLATVVPSKNHHITPSHWKLEWVNELTPNTYIWILYTGDLDPLFHQFRHELLRSPQHPAGIGDEQA